MTSPPASTELPASTEEELASSLVESQSWVALGWPEQGWPELGKVPSLYRVWALELSWLGSSCNLIPWVPLKNLQEDVKISV